MDIILDL